MKQYWWKDLGREMHGLSLEIDQWQQVRDLIEWAERRLSEEDSSDIYVEALRVPGLSAILNRGDKPEPELLPCPFCGSKDVTAKTMPGYGSRVTCNICYVCRNFSETICGAIQLWNKRATDD